MAKEPAAPGFRVEDLLLHREWVGRVARTLVRGDAEAEDLAQQAWVRILRNPPREAPRNARAWLRGVLRFAAMDRGRAERSRREHEAAAPPAISSPADPGDVVSRAETLDRLVHAVLALEEPARTTVLLRYFEDLGPGEIARRQGVPVETVRTRLKRALERLRGRLDGESGGDRRAWCLVLLPLAREPEAAGAGAAVATAAATGGVLMAKKAAVAAAIVGVLALAAYLVVEGRAEGEPATEAARAPGDGSGRAAAPNRRPGAAGDRAFADGDAPAPRGADGAPGDGPGEPSAGPPDFGETRKRTFRDIATGEALPGLALAVEFLDPRTSRAAHAEVVTDAEGSVDLPGEGLRDLRPRSPDRILLTEPRSADDVAWVCRSREVHGTVRTGTGEAIDLAAVRLEVILACGVTSMGARAGSDPWNADWFGRRRIDPTIRGPALLEDSTFRLRVPAIPEVGIRASLPGWIPAYRAIPAEGGRVDLVLLSRAPHVDLIVSDADGSPVRNADVQLFSTNRMRPEDVKDFVTRYRVGGLTAAGGADAATVNLLTGGRTLDDGTLRVEVAVPGDVTVVVSGVDGHAPLSRSLGRLDTPMEGVRMEMVRLDPEDRIRFTIDGDASLLAGLRVNIGRASINEHPQWAFGVTLDSDGAMPAGNLRVGEEYVVHFPGAEYRRLDWQERRPAVDFADVQDGRSLTEALRRWAETQRQAAERNSRTRER